MYYFSITLRQQARLKRADVGKLFSEDNNYFIENLFKVKFKKEENNIAHLISANLKLTMNEIKKTQFEMKNLGKEVTVLKQRLEFRSNVLKQKVKKIDEKHENLENQCNELYKNSLESVYFYNKLADLKTGSKGTT